MDKGSRFRKRTRLHTEPDWTFARFLYAKTAGTSEHAPAAEWKKESVAPALDVSPSSIVAYRSDASNSPNFPIDLLGKLYEHTDDMDILFFLGRLLHCTFVPDPNDLPDAADVVPTALTTESLMEHCEVVEAFLGACKDGKITVDEADEIFREGKEAIRAIWMMIQYAMQKRKAE